MRMMKHLHRFPREVVNASYLETSSLGGALSNLF